MEKWHQVAQSRVMSHASEQVSTAGGIKAIRQVQLDRNMERVELETQPDAMNESGGAVRHSHRDNSPKVL